MIRVCWNCGVFLTDQNKYCSFDCENEYTEKHKPKRKKEKLGGQRAFERIKTNNRKRRI